MALDYQKLFTRRGTKPRLCKTSYGSMNQWQNYMTNDWTTYEFLNRQAALSPVRRQPQPPSPHHGFHSDDPAHLQYYQSGGYDDYHKTYLKMQQNGLSPRFPHHGPPALRAGGGGGSWRHVRQVLQAGGNRRLFVDGQTRIQDNNKILYDEIPGVNVIQPVAQDTMRKLKPKSWTGADLRAFKAAEGQNYMIMR